MSELDDLIKIRSNDIAPTGGRILISEPFMYDFYFSRSVVLLAQHGNEGSFGIIVNKPLKIQFNDVVKDFPDYDGQIYLGGPVKSDNLFFIHTFGEEIEDSFEILRGLYWGGDLETVKDLLKLNKLNEQNIRFFLGYSGWSPKQLEAELKRNSWAVSSTNANLVMNTIPEKMWKMSLFQLGKEYSRWATYPPDPGLN